MQAVILAGGQGTRMEKKYPNIPKFLIRLSNKPFVDHVIGYLKENGCDDIIVCAGVLAERVREYIKRKNYGVRIRLSVEKEPLGTGGALSLIKDLIEEDFFLLFGDVYTRVNLGKMLEFHKNKKAVITAVIHKSRHPEDSNLVRFNSDWRITKILKKPHIRLPKTPYNLAAMYLVRYEIKKYLPRTDSVRGLLPKTPYDFEHDLLTKLIDENISVYGYNTKEFIMDFGTPERLAKLEKELQK